jgi:hypothetical protein
MSLSALVNQLVLGAYHVEGIGDLVDPAQGVVCTFRYGPDNSNTPCVMP